MLKTITPCEMRRVEALAMEKTGIPSEKLMERAAAQVARAVARHSRNRAGVVLCLCGTGNNGDDGLAAMRLLAAGDEGFAGCCWMLEGELSADAQREMGKLVGDAVGGTAGVGAGRSDATGDIGAAIGKPIDGSRVQLIRLLGDELPILPSRISCVIDAMFGTGLSRPLSGMAAKLCAVANALAQSGVPVVAVDIPSGLDGATGEVLGCAICASETVTFHRPKLGLYLGQGMNYTGTVTVADIGIPANGDDAEGLLVARTDDICLPPRKRVSHKGTYGRVLLWVGHCGMAGAAAICATAALRAGAGTVMVACPADIVNIVQTLCPCATCLPLPMDSAGDVWALLLGALGKADALGVGCGLGQDVVTAEVLEKLLAHLTQHPMATVIDADALNLIAKHENVLSTTAQHSVTLHEGDNAEMHGDAGHANLRFNLPCAAITPHPAEAARLLGLFTADVMADYVSAAQMLRKRFGTAIVLKGAASVLLAGESIAINPFGTPAMAKGGSGDALTGVLCALLAGKAAGAYADFSELDILQIGCALHGLAGEEAQRRFGERGVLATDLCECLGVVGSVARTEKVRADVPLAKQAQTDSLRENTAQADGFKSQSPLGKTVTVTMDRKLGTRHPEHQEQVYMLNCGYVQEVLADDNEWQDAYIYGISEPIEWFEGEVIAVIHRLNDAEDKWVVAKKGTRVTAAEVKLVTDFQERFFETRIECL